MTIPGQVSTFSQALSELYQPIVRQGTESLQRQYDQARIKELTDTSRRGIYQSGASRKAIGEGVEQNFANALGQFQSAIGQTQAQQVGSLYQQALQQAYEKLMLEQQRKYGIEDYARNTLMNLAGMVVNPLASTLGTAIGYAGAPDVYRRALQGLANQYSTFAGRGPASYPRATNSSGVIVPELPVGVGGVPGY